MNYIFTELIFITSFRPFEFFQIQTTSFTLCCWRYCSIQYNCDSLFSSTLWYSPNAWCCRVQKVEYVSSMLLQCNTHALIIMRCLCNHLVNKGAETFRYVLSICLHYAFMQQFCWQQYWRCWSKLVSQKVNLSSKLVFLRRKQNAKQLAFHFWFSVRPSYGDSNTVHVRKENIRLLQIPPKGKI